MLEIGSWLVGLSLVFTFSIAGLLYVYASRCALSDAESALSDARQKMAFEKEAADGILSVICDATFGLGADGDTILTADPKLEAILGSGLQGTVLSQKMKRLDAARLAVLIKERSSAFNLVSDTTFQARVGRIDADLFVVNRRLQPNLQAGLTTPTDGDHAHTPSFFIGLRLRQPSKGSASLNGDMSKVRHAKGASSLPSSGGTFALETQNTSLTVTERHRAKQRPSSAPASLCGSSSSESRADEPAIGAEEQVRGTWASESSSIPLPPHPDSLGATKATGTASPSDSFNFSEAFEKLQQNLAGDGNVLLKRCHEDSEISFALSSSTHMSHISKHRTPLNFQEACVQTDHCSEIGDLCCSDMKPKHGEGVNTNAETRVTRPPTLHQVTLATKTRFMRQFYETPKETVYQLLLSILVQINPRGKGCCFRHICLVMLHRRVAELITQECQKQFEPKHDWQCSVCRVVCDSEDGEEAERECSMCGTLWRTSMAHLWWKRARRLRRSQIPSRSDRW